MNKPLYVLLWGSTLEDHTYVAGVYDNITQAHEESQKLGRKLVDIYGDDHYTLIDVHKLNKEPEL